MSALDGTSEMAVARETRAQAFLEKSFDLGHLMEVVERGRVQLSEMNRGVVSANDGKAVFPMALS